MLYAVFIRGRYKPKCSYQFRFYFCSIGGYQRADSCRSSGVLKLGGREQSAHTRNKTLKESYAPAATLKQFFRNRSDVPFLGPMLISIFHCILTLSCERVPLAFLGRINSAEHWKGVLPGRLSSFSVCCLM